jgi:hypothetical protein
MKIALSHKNILLNTILIMLLIICIAYIEQYIFVSIIIFILTNIIEILKIKLSK